MRSVGRLFQSYYALNCIIKSEDARLANSVCSTARCLSSVYSSFFVSFRLIEKLKSPKTVCLRIHHHTLRKLRARPHCHVKLGNRPVILEFSTIYKVTTEFFFNINTVCACNTEMSSVSEFNSVATLTYLLNITTVRNTDRQHNKCPILCRQVACEDTRVDSEGEDDRAREEI